MDAINKVHRIYRNLIQEHNNLVGKLNNAKGNSDIIVYLQQEVDKNISQLEWFRKAFSANGEKVDKIEK